MSEPLLIGIDIGTSSCKTVLFDIRGNSLAESREEYGLYRNGVEVEQDPADYVRAVFGGIKSVLASVDGAADRVAGIGLTGQVPTDIFVDRNGQPLMRGISWQDTRATAQAELIASRYTKEQMLAEVGSNVPISPSWSASRLLWVSQNRKEIAGKTYRTLMPKDYIGYVLTGKYMSDGWSCKSTVNLLTGKPCDGLLGFLGYTSGVMPEIGKWSDLRGGLSATAARELGLKQGIPVSNGCSDAPAAMLGSGIFTSPGIAFDSAGTSEIIGMSSATDASADGLMTIPSSVTGSLAVLYGPTQSGSGSLVWLNSVLGRNDYGAAMLEAAKAPCGSGELMFVPYLQGERSPLWNTEVRGSFVNLSINHDRACMTRAVLEGVGFSVRHCLSIAEKASGIKCTELRITGGAGNSELWLKIKSGICGAPVRTLGCKNACALGAAMTAAVGTGIYTDFSQASEKMVSLEKTIKAPPEWVDTYNASFAGYLREVGFSLQRTEIL